MRSGFNILTVISAYKYIGVSFVWCFLLNHHYLTYAMLKLTKISISTCKKSRYYTVSLLGTSLSTFLLIS